MAVSEAQFEELVKRVERLETGLHQLEVSVEQRCPQGLSLRQQN